MWSRHLPVSWGWVTSIPPTPFRWNDKGSLASRNEWPEERGRRRRESVLCMTPQISWRFPHTCTQGVQQIRTASKNKIRSIKMVQAGKEKLLCNETPWILKLTLAGRAWERGYYLTMYCHSAHMIAAFKTLVYIASVTRLTHSFFDGHACCTNVAVVTKTTCISRAAERIGGPMQSKYRYKKWTLQNGGSGGTPSGNFEILHPLRCVLGTPRIFFMCAHSTCIPATLSSLISVQHMGL